MTRPQKRGENEWEWFVPHVISLADPATGTGALTEYFRTRVTKVGPEALELVEGAILILFADGAPAELAEVSVQHLVESAPTEAEPAVGAQLKIGDVSARLTAIGDHAWKKIADIGHVVINFNGAEVTPRPGEICAAEVDLGALAAALCAGAEISIRA
jgi:PTS system glucitol/sorbitol-specific IIA component